MNMLSGSQLIHMVLQLELKVRPKVSKAQNVQKIGGSTVWGDFWA